MSHLNSLDPRKSTGPDGLFVRLLKEIADMIAAPLATLFNCSLQSGVVPSDWKRSHITPVVLWTILATSDQSLLCLSVLAKVLEKVVSVQHGTFLEQNNLIREHVMQESQLRIFCC